MKTVCPMCGNYLIMQGGCSYCPTCFWSACSIYFKSIVILFILLLSTPCFADSYDDAVRRAEQDRTRYQNNYDLNNSGYYKQNDTTARPDYSGGYYHSDGTHRSAEGRVYMNDYSKCYVDGYGATHCD